MKKLILIAVLVLPIQAFAGDNCAELAQKMEKCESYICTMADMQKPELEITHNITGFTDDGKCHHSQQTHQGLVVCEYSEKTRMVVARLAKNRGKKNVDSKDLEASAAAFLEECNFVE